MRDLYNGKWLELYGFFGSGLEYGMIEQLQDSNLVAASTIKILQLANTNHQAIYLANSTNWLTTYFKLSNYSVNTLNAIYGKYIAGGCYVLLPQNGLTQLGGTNTWAGFGYAAVAPGVAGFMIVGDPQHNANGGYVSDLNAIVNTPFINYSGYVQPGYYSLAPPSLPNLTGADPVNMADGTFQVQADDLSLGQTEPRGLNLSRYYSSSRRNSNLAGMAPGWIHNYYLNAATISAPQAGLGGTTPAQMAPMLAATAAAISIYDRTPGPKNWMVRTLDRQMGH